MRVEVNVLESGTEPRGVGATSAGSHDGVTDWFR